MVTMCTLNTSNHPYSACSRKIPDRYIVSLYVGWSISPPLARRAVDRFQDGFLCGLQRGRRAWHNFFLVREMMSGEKRTCYGDGAIVTRNENVSASHVM